MTQLPPQNQSRSNDPNAPGQRTALFFLGGLWVVLFFAALFAPPLFDDADATHANAARHIVLSGDWVTLYVNGIRYLEKAPLPYWLVAISFKIFGMNVFATHLPQGIGVLLLTLLGYHWARRCFGLRTAFYTGLGVLTSAGVFLFTRILIPEVLLSLFLCSALYCLLQLPGQGALSGRQKLYPYAMWSFLALAVLTKGLVALIFFFGTAIAYVALTGEYKNLRVFKPFTGGLLFLAIAAPWHILAGWRNTGGMSGHGFFWFYFINEHVLRFLGRRIPMDYNKLPGYLYCGLHLVWLFPWSLFAPGAIVVGLQLWRERRLMSDKQGLISQLRLATNVTAAGALASRTVLLLGLYSTLVLLFFGFSTNQEYYTFPMYLPLLLLIMASLTQAEQRYASDPVSRRWITVAHVTLTLIGMAIAITLFLGLWSSRQLPFVPDIGDLLAHRGVGDYTLSMSHLFDLTGPSFAALRLPATLAAFAFAFGPAIAWALRVKRRHLASTSAIAITSAVFLIAAHIALMRFGPMLSSQDLAAKIQELEDDRAISRDNQVLLYGDQAYGSSIPFYLGEDVCLIEGRSSSMLFGSSFADAPKIFLTDQEFLKVWGTGERKILFVPLEKRDVVDKLLGDHKILLEETSGKALFTDRPLDHQSLHDPLRSAASVHSKAR